MKQFWLHSLYGFIVWLWSWSLPVLRLCYRMLTGIHVRRGPTGCRKCDHSDSEWSGILSQRVNSTRSVFVENQARIEGIYKYFSLSTPDYFYWQLERKTSPYISVSLYENIDNIYVRNDFVTEWLLSFRTTRKSMFRLEKTQRRESPCGGFCRQPTVLAIPVSDPVSDKDLGVIYISYPQMFYTGLLTIQGDISQWL